MQQQTYSFEELLFDESFQNYALHAVSKDIMIWEDYLHDHPKQADEAQRAVDLLKTLQFRKQSLSNQHIQAELTRMHQRIETKKHTKSAPFFLHHWQKIAAILVLAAILSGFLISKYQLITPKELVWTEVVVPKGEIKNIILPDNSVVFLNAGTKLRYADNFAKKTREIFLEGEAFFDVTHNEEKPFIVHTCETDITVMGTAFNVQAYKEEKNHMVSLERGKVSIGRPDETPAILAPNQSWLLLRNKKTVKVYKSDNITAQSSWRRGKIVFKNQRFADIIRRLERSHNVTFKVENQDILNSRYTGEFSMDEDIPTILKIINLTAPFTYNIENNTIIIR